MSWMYKNLLVLALLWSIPALGQQLTYDKQFYSSHWHYAIDFADNLGQQHQAFFLINQKDLESGRRAVRRPEHIQESIDRYAVFTIDQLNEDLKTYAAELELDMQGQLFYHADQLMTPLPSGSRIHVKIDEDSYQFEGHLARDFRFWLYNEYNETMKQAVADIGVYLDELIKDRDRAIKNYRTQLQFQLDDSVQQERTRLFDEGLLSIDRSRLRIDYRQAVRRSLWQLRSLSRGLDSIGSDRQRVAKVLTFFQTIPYLELLDKDSYTALGFQMPVVTVDKNEGDCDSKAVGAAAVLKNLMPSRRILLVLIPNHALLAMQISPQTGDDIIHHGGQEWVLLEPVGPSLLEPGKVDPRSLQAIEDARKVSYIEL